MLLGKRLGEAAELLRLHRVGALIALRVGQSVGGQVPHFQPLILLRYDHRLRLCIYLGGGEGVEHPTELRRFGCGQLIMDDEHIGTILEAVENRRNIEKFCRVVQPEEIEENDHNLNITRYVDTFEEEEEIDIPAVQKEIKGLETELAGVRKQMDGYLKELGLSK